MSGLTDSAGVPWEGRAFHANPSAGDDGAADPALLAALAAFRAGDVDAPAVVAALAGARVLVPLVTEAGVEGVSPAGHRVDKTQELALVTVAAADGRPVLPVFSSVETLSGWNPRARPIPVGADRAALAAAADGLAALVLDPGAPTEFAVRRSAFEAIATGTAWQPAWRDAEVRALAEAGAAGESAVTAVSLDAGDPTARFAGPELRVSLDLVPGLDRAAIDALLTRIGERWAASRLPDLVDGIGVRLR